MWPVKVMDLRLTAVLPNTVKELKVKSERREERMKKETQRERKAKQKIRKKKE